MVPLEPLINTTRLDHPGVVLSIGDSVRAA